MPLCIGGAEVWGFSRPVWEDLLLKHNTQVLSYPRESIFFQYYCKPPVGCLSLGSPCAKGAHCTSPANVGQRLVVRRGTPVHARAHIARDHVSTVTYILLYNPVVVAN